MQTEQVDMKANLNNKKREEFRVYLIESIEKALNFTQIVFNFLERNADFNQEYN